MEEALVRIRDIDYGDNRTDHAIDKVGIMVFVADKALKAR